MKNQQSGFTLVELVAVIVLLGILAVTALPRFVDLQGDARQSVISGVQASFEGAATQVYAKSLLAGVESVGGAATAGTTVTVNGSLVEVRNGYPEAIADGPDQDIIDLLQIKLVPDAGAALTQQDVGGRTVRIGYDFDDDGSVTDNGCYVSYVDAVAGETPAITPTISGC